MGIDVGSEDGMLEGTDDGEEVGSCPPTPSKINSTNNNHPHNVNNKCLLVYLVVLLGDRGMLIITLPGFICCDLYPQYIYIQGCRH